MCDGRKLPRASREQLILDYNKVLKENERLRAALEAVEWVINVEHGLPSYSHCPWCDNLKEEDHHQNCQRQLALRRQDEQT